MVLSYYIATQTFEEHLEFFSLFFFCFLFLLLFLKNKMQHIPVVSHVLSGGTFNLGIVVPATQTCGSYHRQDDVVFIYSGRGASRGQVGSGGGSGVRWGQEMLRFPTDFNGWMGGWVGGWMDGDWGGGLQWYLFTNGGRLCLALLTSAWVSALEKVQRVGGPTVVPLYIQWVEPWLDYSCPPQSLWWCHLSLCAPHPANPLHPHLQARFCKLPFLMRFCPGGRTDWQQRGNFISYTNS